MTFTAFPLDPPSSSAWRQSVSRSGDRARILVGHDTNPTNVAGSLDLTRIANGRRDDTPPQASRYLNLGIRERARKFPCSFPDAVTRTSPAHGPNSAKFYFG